MVKKAELEISGKMFETVKRLEDPVQRQRNLVEQERQKYLSEEEKIVKKLWWVEKTLRICCISLLFFVFVQKYSFSPLSSTKLGLCMLF